MPTIAELAVSDDRFNLLVSSLQLVDSAVPGSDLIGAASDPAAQLTVFAPTDDAFIKLAETLGYEAPEAPVVEEEEVEVDLGDGEVGPIDVNTDISEELIVASDGETSDDAAPFDLEADAFGYLARALNLLSGGEAPSLLNAVLTYHIAPGALSSTDVLAATEITTLGGTVGVNAADATLVDADPDIADPALVLLDIEADNGVIHAIDGVLLPADLLASDGADDVDFIIEGDDNDRISTGADRDYVDAGGGNDRVFLGKGDDVGFGGDGRDFISGSSGDDLIFGNADRDTISGGSGADTISGDEGNDRLYSGSGDDEVSGGAGRDIIYAGSGDDNVSGGDDNDFIASSFGNDTIDGGAGDDRIYTGWGDDVIVFEAGDGEDTIKDFNTGRDVIDLSSYGFTSFDDLDISSSGGSNGGGWWSWWSWWWNPRETEIDLGDGDSITLTGVRAGSLDEDNFIL